MRSTATAVAISILFITQGVTSETLELDDEDYEALVESGTSIRSSWRIIAPRGSFGVVINAQGLHLLTYCSSNSELLSMIMQSVEFSKSTKHISLDKSALAFSLHTSKNSTLQNVYLNSGLSLSLSLL
jgi:hypothetical protein